MIGKEKYEAGESSPSWPESTEEEKKKTAEELVLMLNLELNSTENDKNIDLDKPSSVVDVPNFDKKSLLKSTVATLKGYYLDYLDPTKRHMADGLIIKAEIYLAAYEPKKEE